MLPSILNAPLASAVIVAPTPSVPLLYVYAGNADAVAYATDALGSNP